MKYFQVQLKLEDRGSNELFAACPIDQYPGPAVEAVTDSSRWGLAKSLSLFATLPPPQVFCDQDSGRQRSKRLHRNRFLWSVGQLRPQCRFARSFQGGDQGEGDCQGDFQTLPKAQRTRGLSSSCQSNFFRSHRKFKHKSWSHFIFRISTNHQLKISSKHQHLH